MDRTAQTDSRPGQIDRQIMTHIVHETTLLLEEAQMHALIERRSFDNAVALSHATWRLASISAWANVHMRGTPSRAAQTERLLAAMPAPSTDTALSETLRNYTLRVIRLHERALRLQELAHDNPVATVRSFDESGRPAKNAEVIRLWPQVTSDVPIENNVETARSRIAWAMSAL